MANRRNDGVARSSITTVRSAGSTPLNVVESELVMLTEVAQGALSLATRAQACGGNRGSARASYRWGL